ncbi:Olfactory Receptor 2T33 [Manis pentadactyla]|nr:Olfactory Receptor 2T33 [Manis pentadactyla]
MLLRGDADPVMLEVIIFIIVAFTSLLGNALVILLIHRDPRLHTPMYFLLSQLSLMDMMLVCTIVPKMAADYVTGRKSISPTGCGVQIFFLLTLGGGFLHQMPMHNFVPGKSDVKKQAPYVEKVLKHPGFQDKGSGVQYPA